MEPVLIGGVDADEAAGIAFDVDHQIGVRGENGASPLVARSLAKVG